MLGEDQEFPVVTCTCSLIQVPLFRVMRVMERLLEEISFTATDQAGLTLVVDEKFVQENIGDLVRNADLSKFIL